jgi:uncharacterized protein YggT (Ycf19 family)
LLGLYTIAVFGRVLLSWFPVRDGSPIASVNSALYAITEPVLGPLRRVMPSVGGGGLRIDLSPTIVIFALLIIRSRLGCDGLI